MFYYFRAKRVIAGGTTLDFEILSGETSLCIGEYGGERLYVVKSDDTAEGIISRQHPQCCTRQVSCSEVEPDIKSSRVYNDINEIVKTMIRAKYSEADELRIQGVGSGADYDAYVGYLSECRAYGDGMKKEWGLEG